MEKKIAIVTDTNSGLSTEQANAHGVYLIPMPVIIDHNTFLRMFLFLRRNFLSVWSRVRESALHSRD